MSLAFPHSAIPGDKTSDTHVYMIVPVQKIEMGVCTVSQNNSLFTARLYAPFRKLSPQCKDIHVHCTIVTSAENCLTYT